MKPELEAAVLVAAMVYGFGAPPQHAALVLVAVRLIAGFSRRWHERRGLPWS